MIYISKSKKEKVIDFLTLAYEKINFLINKEQFIAGIYLDNPKHFETNIKYFNSTILYKQEIVPIFNLSLFLAEIFEIQENFMSNLLLIMNLEILKEKSIKFLKNTYSNSSKPPLSQKYIAIRVTSNSKIKKYKIKKLSLIPTILRKFHFKYGIIGLNFPNESNTINYFIDLEKIIFNDKFFTKTKTKQGKI